MNDDYFRALGWIGLGLAVCVEWWERCEAWLRREWRMLRQVIR